jgi:membrane protease YdiL (CAAX protease family)
MPDTTRNNTIPPPGQLPWPGRLFQLLELLVVFSPALLVIFVFQVFEIDQPMLYIGVIWVANIAMLTLIWIGVRMRGDAVGSVGLSVGRPGVADVGLTVLKSLPVFALAAAAFIFVPTLMAGFAEAPPEADMSMYDNALEGNLPLLLISLVGVYIVSSMGEEVVYRGFLITRLNAIFGGIGWLSTGAALVLSSVIFGVAHYQWGVTGMVQTTAMGAALGMCFLIFRRRLWPLILAHAYMDTLLFVQLYLGG